ncbi:hypothetical protein A1O1_07803 [Capronia coronata CBS 617.96]|uniref:Uncharacterized protein n=1 Tax=Capronia coronata CBS 617.96 TaxID=1182541 RepID=W9XNC7_9EURO|nr:uncharacterized protein A1O1_07803 [Capronia coronata CBS 617.96]EXJ81738.1 hypothetical protein A1O1_07803 [Capronia coronata CBS 617.96]
MLLPPRSRRAKAHPPARNSSRRQGRPMKAASELRPTRKARTEYAQLLHSQASGATATSKTQSSHQLSHLESLPVELIEHIFFYSFEVNMPRASTYLAQVLSKPSIYKALTLFAYFDNLGDGIPVETYHFRPAEYRRISLDEKLRLQTGILGCKWFTSRLLKSCMPALSRLQMVQAWHHESRAERTLNISPDEPSLSAPLVANERLRSVASLPAIDDEPGMEKHFLAKLEQQQAQTKPRDRVLGPTGDNNTLPRIMEWSSSIDEDGQLHKTIHHATSVLAARVLLDRIVCGSPWTDSKLELLQLLRQGMRFLVAAHVLEISAAALFQGMASAIREGHEQALLVLLELHYATMRLHPTYDRGHFDGTGIWERRYLVAPFAHPLPVDLFHLAVKQKYASQDDAEAGKERPSRAHTQSQLEARLDGEGYLARIQHMGESSSQSQSETDSRADGQHEPPLHPDSHSHPDGHEHEHEQDKMQGSSSLRSHEHHTSTARILGLLLREGIDSVSPDDQILTRWAAHTWANSASSLERRLAQWLLEHMSGSVASGADDYGLALTRGEALLVNGKLSSRRRPGHYPFPETSFTDEIGYLVEGAVGDVVRARDGGPCG